MNLDNQKRLSKDIIVYENFLTEEECSAIINVLEDAVKNETISWTPISFYESYSSILPQDGDPSLEKFKLPSTFFSDIKNKIISAVASIDNVDRNSIVKIGYHTQKWEPGAFARPHSDNTDEEGNPSAFERSRYAAFIYLNEDFDGGVLNFVKNNISIKPKTGLLAAFAGGFENMHEVTLITKGIRYTLGSFWDDREESDYPEELRRQWEEEIKKVREYQEKEKAEWQEIIKEGYKLDQQGNKYRIEELDK